MLLCGLDEAGRGPLAGPLVAAAVILPDDFDFAARFPKVRFGDSKKLSERQRDAAFDLIQKYALAFTIARIDVHEIDLNGIGWANKTVFERLIAAMEADRYVVDGNLKLNSANIAPEKRDTVQSVIRADQTEQAVSAASIIAKVMRDRLMDRLHVCYPEYHWHANKGYGTREHIAAIRAFGTTPYHRSQYVATALSHHGKIPQRTLFSLS